MSFDSGCSGRQANRRQWIKNSDKLKEDGESLSGGKRKQLRD